MRGNRERWTSRPLGASGLALLLVGLSACRVGPTYKVPSAPSAPAFKEQPPPEFKEAGDWQPAQPSDGLMKGKWWELYNDPVLNQMEEQVSISNLNLLQAEAQYRQARSAVLTARAALFPTAGASPSISEARGGTISKTVTPNGKSELLSGSSNTQYTLPLTASWEPDLWGSIRRGMTAAAATAQASAAQLENLRLLYQSELAQDYFQLHGTDSDVDLLNRTAKSYEEYVVLTRNRFAGGIASDLDVAQAEAQLYATQAEMQDLGVARAQLEHAIAVLTGKPPAEVTIQAQVLKNPPPVFPVVVPSALLERRPDIANAERTMAAANEQIGITQAAFYPTLSLSGTLGLESLSIAKWFTGPSRFFAVGPSLAETLFDAGRRRAAVAGAQAAYDATVAAYRQSVLNAFAQVEDELAALRVLAEESVTATDSVKAANRALDVSTAQYKAGTTSYLTVITAQGTALAAQETLVNLLTRRLVASVALIQALGGGWDSTQLPGKRDLTAGK
ncbi:MAG: efflux transporter outer membrane subunit [Bryobacteraceae bacterium]|jgi:NodT family efflux transporter outer membrane factor (OMF) lipoprotein